MSKFVKLAPRYQNDDPMLTKDLGCFQGHGLADELAAVVALLKALQLLDTA